MTLQQTSIFDVLSESAGGHADHVPVIHIITPDFSTLCREDYLELSDRGDKPALSPHRDDRDQIEVDLPGRAYKGLRWTRIRWRNITCPWCRSLGHTYYRHCVRFMSGHQG